MRKLGIVWLMLIVTLLCLTCFSACSGTDENVTPPKEEDKQSDEIIKEEDTPGDKIIKEEEQPNDKIVIEKFPWKDSVLNSDWEGTERKFYTLQEAYDNGWITLSDLQVIADYLNNRTFPQDKLDDSTKTAIIATAVKSWSDERYEAKAEDFSVQYYGTYGSYVAVILNNSQFAYPAVEADVEVAGVTFHYPYPNMIRIWVQQ